MTDLHNTLLYFLAAAFTQNLVLTTGIGSALTLRMTRRTKNHGIFALCLLAFSVLTISCFYPIDHTLGTGEWAKLIRPLILVAISAVWYLVSLAFFKRLFPRFYEEIRTMLPLAAINTVVTGIGLIANHQFHCSFLMCIGLAAGACIGFILVFLLLGEGIDRMQHEEMPKAFAGLPAQFLYLGILALALCGFSANISFV